MTDREIMQQALDAFKDTHYRILSAGLLDQDLLNRNFTVATALRERLARCDRCGKPLGGESDIHTCTPPAAQRQWVGLTKDDLREIIVDLKRPADLYKAIEAKLKEKNT